MIRQPIRNQICIPLIAALLQIRVQIWLRLDGRANGVFLMNAAALKRQLRGHLDRLLDPVRLDQMFDHLRPNLWDMRLRSGRVAG